MWYKDIADKIANGLIGPSLFRHKLSKLSDIDRIKLAVSIIDHKMIDSYSVSYYTDIIHNGGYYGNSV